MLQLRAFFSIGDLIFLLLASIAIFLYLFAAIYSSRWKKLRPWPAFRSVFWSAGVLLSAGALAGPLAAASHTNFIAHMAGHLMLGMLGPLLLVLSSPVTLLLRSLPVSQARKVSRLLKSRVAGFIIHPVIASILNTGGLWLLYGTGLYEAMHHSFLLHLLIHFHVFTAGYLFTVSMLYIDPVSRRFSYSYRTAVFIFALAGHGILSKVIYAYPPSGVSAEEARIGAMLMYYGGDAIDLIIIVLLFAGWYSASRPRNIAPAHG